MDSLTSHQVLVMLLSFGVLLGVARLLGELALRLHQPAVVGELLAGVLLGPTVLGWLAPETQAWLFPATGPNALALNAISIVAIVLFLLVAGMEVDLSILARQGRAAPLVGLAGIAIPFSVGFLVAIWRPEMLGAEGGGDVLLFALFFATALSISALPVIAKTLLDLGLYRSDLGMLVISAAILNDLIGWLIFAFILGMLPGNSVGSGIASTLLLTLLYVGLILTLGRWLIHRILPWVQAYSRWPAGELGFALTLALLAGAFTEWIGIHAIFGSFLAGVAIGDSSHLRERTRVIIDQFVSAIFAPLFFAAIGVQLNFRAHFDLKLVLWVLLISCACKLLGGYWGARWGRLPRRDAWAVGFALNARGGMVIILGLLALQAGIINQRLFVALVLMGMVTSIMSGPFMKWIIRHSHAPRLVDLLGSRSYLPALKARNREEAVAELSEVAARLVGQPAAQIHAAVWTREQLLPTGLGNGLAVPHARLPDLAKPVVVMARSSQGVDFDSPDGQPARLIFLLLTPRDDAGVQLAMLSELSHLFHAGDLVDQVMKLQSYTEIIALLKARPQASAWI